MREHLKDLSKFQRENSLNFFWNARFPGNVKNTRLRTEPEGKLMEEHAFLKYKPEGRAGSANSICCVYHPGSRTCSRC